MTCFQTCFVSMAHKKLSNINSNLINIGAKNHAEILTSLGSMGFQIFRSSALLSKILLSDLKTHGFSKARSEGSELDINWPIFVIFGGMMHQSLSSFELQNELDSTNSFPDIERFSFLLDHPSYVYFSVLSRSSSCSSSSCSSGALI